MNADNKVFDWITHPRKILIYLVRNVMAPIIPDRLYVKIMGRINLGYWMDLDNPKTFNEKMNWLKLHDHNPHYSTLVDKVKVKKVVASLIGDEYVVPIIKVWDKVEDIDFTELPERCILKTNQDSGGAVKFYQGMDTTDVFKNLNGRMHLFNYYYFSREWPYRGVEKKVFAEQMLGNLKEGEVLDDYKFWCFNGKPQIMYVTCKSDSFFENFYDLDFNPLDINHDCPRRVPEFDKPKDFEKMIELATILSTGIPFVRIDFFYVDGKIYFGEYTFFDWGGLRPFSGDWDMKLGNYLSLENVKQ